MNTPPRTDMASMPITPYHQQIIDEAIQAAIARVQELAPTIGYFMPPPLAPEQIQQSTLAKQLRIIARYAEGYELGEGDIRPIIRQVARILYPVPMKASGYQFPPNLHKSPLGEMVHTALARHHPAETRMTVGEVVRQLHVTRQSVHTWAEDGTLTPIYDKGILTFTRVQVEYLEKLRAARTKTEE